MACGVGFNCFEVSGWASMMLVSSFGNRFRSMLDPWVWGSGGGGSGHEGQGVGLVGVAGQGLDILLARQATPGGVLDIARPVAGLLCSAWFSATTEAWGAHRWAAKGRVRGGSYLVVQLHFADQHGNAGHGCRLRIKLGFGLKAQKQATRS